MKIFENVVALSEASLAAGQVVKVKGVGEFIVMASGVGPTLENDNVAVPTGPITGTSAEIEDVGSSINVNTKAIGGLVFNTTTTKPVYASGSGPTDVWVDATGATAHTPA